MNLNNIKKMVRSRLPRLYMCLGQCYHSVKECMDDIASVFHKKQFQDAEYIILRRVDGIRNGIFSDLLVWLPTLYNASDYGKKVVVDMKNYVSPYGDGMGENNPWEFWYKQPTCEGDVTLDDVVAGNAGAFLYWDNPLVHYFNKEHPFDFPWKPLYTYDKTQILEWHQIYAKYIRYTDEMLKKVETEWERICAIKGDKKVLGVKFRGTDYRPEYLVENHPHQVAATEMIEHCKAFIHQHGGGGTSISILPWMRKNRWSYLRMLLAKSCCTMIAL